MEISQDSTISFSSKISVDLGLKENNAFLLFKSDLPFRMCDELVQHIRGEAQGEGSGAGRSPRCYHECYFSF